MFYATRRFAIVPVIAQRVTYLSTLLRNTLCKEHVGSDPGINTDTIAAEKVGKLVGSEPLQ